MKCVFEQNAMLKRIPRKGECWCSATGDKSVYMRIDDHQGKLAIPGINEPGGEFYSVNLEFGNIGWLANSKVADIIILETKSPTVFFPATK